MRTWLLAMVLAVPLVAGHGAPDPREIDTRIMVDGTENFDYGTATQDDPRILYEGGHDLLTLDVREGFDAARGGHLLMWRLVMQFGDPTFGELREVVSFQADGSSHEVTIRTTDNSAFTVEGADGFALLDIGDDHVHGVEFWHNVSALGLTVGSGISEIRVAGFVGSSPADVMPGTYHLGGVPVPGEAGAPATWSVQGPAALFAVEVEGNWTFPGGNGAGSILISSPLNAMGQFLTLEYTIAGNGTAPAAGQLVLDPRGTRRVNVDVLGAVDGDVLHITMSSDLTAQATLQIPISVPAVPSPSPTTDAPAQDTPAWAVAPILALLAIVRCRKL